MLTRHLLEKLQKKPNYKNEQSIENKQNELKREARILLVESDPTLLKRHIEG